MTTEVRAYVYVAREANGQHQASAGDETVEREDHEHGSGVDKEEIAYWILQGTQNPTEIKSAEDAQSTIQI